MRELGALCVACGSSIHLKIITNSSSFSFALVDHKNEERVQEGLLEEIMEEIHSDTGFLL